ncbi:MAG: hypothetical protein AB1345_14290 [Chloroflexota bacterium]
MVAVDQFAPLGLLIVAGSCLFLLFVWKPGWQLLALMGMYLGVFGLVASIWPLELALVKLVAGWVSVVILGFALVGTGYEAEKGALLSGLIRLLAGLLISLVAISLTPTAKGWLPQVSPEVLIGGIMLLGLGLLQISLTTRILPLILGLLTCLAGFEVLYARLELSVLVTGLLATVNICLALLGAYLLVNMLEVRG